MSEYKIVAKPGVGEFVDKKSRFIAHVYAIDSEEQAQGYIEELKKKYWDARHNCYGYVLGKNNETQRFSDDGEPSGTAGKPILEVIKGNDIHNILIVVTRYFGGTLLGTGGLIRAYTKSSQDGIENASIVCKIQGIRTKIETDYNGIGKIQYIAASMGIKNIDTIYNEKVIIDITVKKEDYDGFEKKVVEATNGKAVFGEREEAEKKLKNGGTITLQITNSEGETDTQVVHDIEEWEKYSDWNKFILIPVLVTTDASSSNSYYGSSSNVISIQHDLKPGYARLKGGTNSTNASLPKEEQDKYKLKLEVVSTNFGTKSK